MLFDCKRLEDIEALADKIHAIELKVFSDDIAHGAMGDTLNKDIQNISFRLRALEERISTEKTAPDSEIKARLDDLELWRGKIHAMLTQTDAKKREKISSFARRFRGRL